MGIFVQYAPYELAKGNWDEQKEAFAGIMADGLASAVSVLGPENGLKLIDQTRGAAALIVRAPEGGLQTCRSCRWERFSAASPPAK